MLVQHLREMEEDGLVHREIYREVPPRVEYSLTEHGKTLNEALRPLGRWGTERAGRLAAEDTPTTRRGHADEPLSAR
jgi:DNA-binding HxlR family transcriptional regulator